MTPPMRGLAANPALPAHLLDHLITTAGDDLGPILARRDDLTTARARVLATRCGASVLYPLLERGLLTPADIPFGDPWRGPAVLEHPDADPAWFNRLARDPDPVIRCELSARFPLPAPITLIATLAGNPATSLEALPADAHELIRWKMASRTDLAADVYAKLAEDDLPGTRWDLAGNPAAVAFLPRLLARDSSREMKRAAALNPRIPLALLAELAPETKIGLLVPRVATATEAELHAPAAQVRRLAAARPDLPPDLLARFTEDPDAGVARMIAPNPDLNPAQLRRIARHGPPVYARLAANPRCPADLARVLLAGAQVKALRVLAGHPGLRPESIVDLLGHPDDRVVTAAAANPALAVAVMSTSTGWAGHPGIPHGIGAALKKLR
ncbi:hypothetical protein ACIA5G_11980 [Amycolatopsis sp. NPDC051758]|uniref:hypothetical protein n=1 Tax=Amycolatopsis sp. NPDC051758 TaxID=3363935 RepID=UPI003796A509